MGLLVRNLYNRKLATSTTVDASEPLSRLVRKFHENSHVRGIFLVAKDGKLYGTVTSHDLLSFMKLKLPNLAKLPVPEIAETLKNTQAKDAVHKFSYAASVTPDTSIDEALKAMVMLDLVDIPVVDGERRIIGEITLTAILNKVLKTPRKRKREN